MESKKKLRRMIRTNERLQETIRVRHRERLDVLFCRHVQQILSPNYFVVRSRNEPFQFSKRPRPETWTTFLRLHHVHKEKEIFVLALRARSVFGDATGRRTTKRFGTSKRRTVCSSFVSWQAQERRRSTRERGYGNTLKKRTRTLRTVAIVVGALVDLDDVRR